MFVNFVKHIDKEYLFVYIYIVNRTFIHGGAYMRKLVFIVLLISSVVLIGTFASGNTTNSKQNTYYEIHYIKSGDTLWDIAKLYSNSDNISAYVDEIMTFNHMKNPNIQSGQNIIIPVHKD